MQNPIHICIPAIPQNLIYIYVYLWHHTINMHHHNTVIKTVECVPVFFTLHNGFSIMQSSFTYLNWLCGHAGVWSSQQVKIDDPIAHLVCSKWHHLVIGCQTLQLRNKMGGQLLLIHACLLKMYMSGMSLQSCALQYCSNCVLHHAASITTSCFCMYFVNQ